MKLIRAVGTLVLALAVMASPAKASDTVLTDPAGDATAIGALESEPSLDLRAMRLGADGGDIVVEIDVEDLHAGEPANLPVTCEVARCSPSRRFAAALYREDFANVRIVAAERPDGLGPSFTLCARPARCVELAGAWDVESDVITIRVPVEVVNEEAAVYPPMAPGDRFTKFAMTSHLGAFYPAARSLHWHIADEAEASGSWVYRP